MADFNLNQFEEVYAAFRVFILDIDGTLMNGNALIDGTLDAVYRLISDPEKKVLFYTNGGYCTLQDSFDKVYNWLKNNLGAEKWAQIEPKVNISTMYNTAQLAARYLLNNLATGAKVLCFGNVGMNYELQAVGLNSEILAPMLPGETEYSPRFTDVDFANYVTDPEVKAIAFGVCQLFDARKLCVASMYLQSENGMDFVTTNDDPVFVAGANGRLMPDVGATLAALETASGRTATRIGKPDKFAMGEILKDHFADEQARWAEPDYLKQFCYVGDNI